MKLKCVSEGRALCSKKTFDTANISLKASGTVKFSKAHVQRSAHDAVACTLVVRFVQFAVSRLSSKI